MVIHTPREEKGGAKNVYLENVPHAVRRRAMEGRRIQLYLLMLLVM